MKTFIRQTFTDLIKTPPPPPASKVRIIVQRMIVYDKQLVEVFQYVHVFEVLLNLYFASIEMGYSESMIND